MSALRRSERARCRAIASSEFEGSACRLRAESSSSARYAPDKCPLRSRDVPARRASPTIPNVQMVGYLVQRGIWTMAGRTMDGRTRGAIAKVRAAELAEHARILGQQADLRVTAVVRTCLRRLPARLPIRGGERRAVEALIDIPPCSVKRPAIPGRLPCAACHAWAHDPRRASQPADLGAAPGWPRRRRLRGPQGAGRRNAALYRLPTPDAVFMVEPPRRDRGAARAARGPSRRRAPRRGARSGRAARRAPGRRGNARSPPSRCRRPVAPG
jgi:hypothetical protein